MIVLGGVGVVVWIVGGSLGGGGVTTGARRCCNEVVRVLVKAET